MLRCRDVVIVHQEWHSHRQLRRMLPLPKLSTIVGCGFCLRRDITSTCSTRCRCVSELRCSSLVLVQPTMCGLFTPSHRMSCSTHCRACRRVRRCGLRCASSALAGGCATSTPYSDVLRRLVDRSIGADMLKSSCISSWFRYTLCFTYWWAKPGGIDNMVLDRVN